MQGEERDQRSSEGKIIWLASYPKSGNTWLRSLLTAYLLPDEPLDLQALIGGPIQLQRQVLDDHAAISSAEMGFDELLPYRSALHKSLTGAGEGTFFVKTHDAYARSSDGVRLLPPTASAGAIYLVRDPLDIVPSLAHHEGRDLDWTVARMADPQATLNQWPDRTSPSLPERMGCWSGHVASWLEQTDIPVLLLRYEDLHADPVAALTRVSGFSGLPIDTADIAHAVESCSLHRLQTLEHKSGFREAPSAERRFFRSGMVGAGQQQLSTDQRNRMIAIHKQQMERLGYDTQANPSKASVSHRSTRP